MRLEMFDNKGDELNYLFIIVMAGYLPAICCILWPKMYVYSVRSKWV